MLLAMFVAPTDVLAARMSAEFRNGLLWLDLEGASLEAAVMEIGRQAGFETIVIGELHNPVSLKVEAMPLAEALDKLLANTDRIVVYAGADTRADSGQGIARVWLFSAIEAAVPDMGDESPDTLPGDSRERSLAMLRLTRKGATVEVIETLGEALLEDPHPLVRSRAAAALGSLADARSLGMLASALEDPSQTVRAQALQALGQIGGPHASRILGDVLLQNPDARMRLLAVKALHRDSSPQARAYLEAAAGDSDSQVREAAQEAPAPAVEGSGKPPEIDR